MLTLATQLRRDLQEVKDVVVWQDALRSAINALPLAITPGPTIDPISVVVLRDQAPAKLAWQIFDHYAAVSRIYALFEKTVRDLVGEFLSVLPIVAPSYDTLSDRVRQQHRIGVGQVLMKWSSTSPIYYALAERDVVRGLADGLHGRPYSLLADAFLLSPENFRAPAIVRLF